MRCGSLLGEKPDSVLGANQQQKTAKFMVFIRLSAASKKWRKFNGTIQLPHVIECVKFTDGVVQTDANQRRAA